MALTNDGAGLGFVSRVLQYRAWARGRAPGYRPTLADLLALAIGH